MTKEMQRVIDMVNKSWNKDQIIRFLYVKLAPFFERDLNFFLASTEEKIRQMQMGFINRGTKICCSTISDYYVSLFASFGIEARKVQVTNRIIPLYAIIVLGDTCWYYIDPLNDLFANQYGMLPKNYGIIPNYSSSILYENYPFIKVLDKNYLREIDESINLYPNGTLDEYLTNLHLLMSSRSLFCKTYGLIYTDNFASCVFKLEFARDNLINLGCVNGFYERGLLYESIHSRLFDKTEKKCSETKFCQENGSWHLRFGIFANEQEVWYEDIKKEDGTFDLKRL